MHEGAGLIAFLVGMVYGIAFGVFIAFAIGMRFPL